MTEVWQPKGDWDTETAESRGARMWDLFTLRALIKTYARSDGDGSELVDADTGEVIVDKDGKATIHS